MLLISRTCLPFWSAGVVVEFRSESKSLYSSHLDDETLKKNSILLNSFEQQILDKWTAKDKRTWRFEKDDESSFELQFARLDFG